jgi:hypothetical protein
VKSASPNLLDISNLSKKRSVTVAALQRVEATFADRYAGCVAVVRHGPLAGLSVPLL